MILNKIYVEKTKVRNYVISGAIVGFIFATLEYLVRQNTDDPQVFVPLVIRAMVTGSLIMGTISIFGIVFENRFRQKSFLFIIAVKSVFYTVCATFFLALINSIWYVWNGEVSVYEELLDYLNDEMYLINLASIFIATLIITSLAQVNSLHGKGELINFIIGRYNRPREIDQIFCFIDLKGSTTIAEKLGHFQFALFLKDYYSDITPALRSTSAQIYQYVGDEIILNWTFKKGFENNNALQCFFRMKQVIEGLRPTYMDKYGVYPEFKAGLHGGKVVVTWVGELKKEIVYVGDVLNTASRIEGNCNRLSKEFLISEELLKKASDLGNITASFVEETIPRGKEKSVRLYSLECQ